MQSYLAGPIYLNPEMSGAFSAQSFRYPVNTLLLITQIQSNAMRIRSVCLGDSSCIITYTEGDKRGWCRKYSEQTDLE